MKRSGAIIIGFYLVVLIGLFIKAPIGTGEVFSEVVLILAVVLIIVSFFRYVVAPYFTHKNSNL